MDEYKYSAVAKALSRPLIFDEDKCIGCNRCVNICQVDVLLPRDEEDKTPRVQYPDECWYCGCCVMACPVEGALTLRHPLMNQVNWVEKKSLVK
ncbi:4Fe-4S dicluster domain-containing protein [Dethiosulfatibacter aminovorans DSM 17477]|uniref:4Fe-4S dicluster domain-containing protein n=1 Tax=Dethiosulfatibacter aminovorans DSM 17477 TaxID=1121476 RepID=A0A1M6C1E1_9FIRM|nr:4Fe-4S binding protein [Dethiosulfatibacter aminovorans]SHI54855.1 4Fe-4S dicluster domain-containing protein [Dethiosulfatibacter aminovorans DSM 17477]